MYVCYILSENRKIYTFDPAEFKSISIKKKFN